MPNLNLVTMRVGRHLIQVAAPIATTAHFDEVEARERRAAADDFLLYEEAGLDEQCILLVHVEYHLTFLDEPSRLE
ncbi:hypothetical protein [Pseudomonas aeruginosa]|uniref:hypothetical protein n=1 Tax=Pseudomonas aeruginosa TaxID=287 RepID=UPI0023580E57|nr:hypothetical protein [Pseudomonas aeruginosa]